MRLIPTGFPVTYLEMAISTFNRLVGEKYLPHLSAPTHPANLASVTNVIVLWKALIDPMVITCGDPIQRNVYYRLYGFNAGLGRVPSNHSTPGSRRALARSAGPAFAWILDLPSILSTVQLPTPVSAMLPRLTRLLRPPFPLVGLVHPVGG